MAIWQEAAAAVAIDNFMARTGISIQALNEIFDCEQKRLTAFRHRVSSFVLSTHYGLAIAAICFASIRTGLEIAVLAIAGLPHGVLVAGIILLIQDTDRPNGGLVAVSRRPMDNAPKALADHAD